MSNTVSHAIFTNKIKTIIYFIELISISNSQTYMDNININNISTSQPNHFGINENKSISLWNKKFIDE